MNTQLYRFSGLLLILILAFTGCKKASNSSNVNPNTSRPRVTTDSAIYNHTPVALCKGTIVDTGAGAVTRYGFCWSDKAHPAVDNTNAFTVEANDLTGSRFSSYIGQMGNGKTYYFRAFAQNANGIGYGMEKTIVTDSFPPVFQDGYYVVGPATAFQSPDSRCMMKVTRNEVNQMPRESLLELYLPLRAGAQGFSIVCVSGPARYTYLPASGFGMVPSGTTNEPKIPFQRGPVSTTGSSPFVVASDGLYHIVFDLYYKKAAIVPVHWGMIGAATPGGWGVDTMMMESSFNLNEMSWTLTNLVMQNGDWRFRYSQGWNVEIDTSDPNPMYWVKVNSNLGGTINELIPGGSNFMNDLPGKYTCTLTCKPGTGNTATLVRTGNLDPFNYSTYAMGIIGDAYYLPSGLPAFWDENFGTQLPVVNGTTYTWSYTLDLIGDKQFKFRQGNDWSGKIIGYNDVTMAGPGAGYFTSSGGDGNFLIAAGAGGNYTLVLKIEALTETYTVTAARN